MIMQLNSRSQKRTQGILATLVKEVSENFSENHRCRVYVVADLEKGHQYLIGYHRGQFWWVLINVKPHGN